MNHSLWRDNKTQKRYKRYVASKPVDAPCEFCALRKSDGQVQHETAYFWIAENLFPYTTWDSFFVDEHLMLIPKRHSDGIGAFTEEELIAFGTLLAAYETKGYSIYGRAANNAAKSVAHQHTHMLKISNRRIRTLIYLRRFGVTLFG